MRLTLGIAMATAVLALNACGDSTVGSAASSPVTPSPSATVPSTEFTYVDPDAAYADRIKVWGSRIKGPKGDYAAKLARQEGWKGDGFAVRDIAVDTCLNLTKYKEGTYTAFYAWTYILNDVGRGNDSMTRTKQALVASYLIGATCPDLGDESRTALREALESIGG